VQPLKFDPGAAAPRVVRHDRRPAGERYVTVAPRPHLSTESATRHVTFALSDTGIVHVSFPKHNVCAIVVAVTDLQVGLSAMFNFAKSGAPLTIALEQHAPTLNVSPLGADTAALDDRKQYEPGGSQESAVAVPTQFGIGLFDACSAASLTSHNNTITVGYHNISQWLPHGLPYAQPLTLDQVTVTKNTSRASRARTHRAGAGPRRVTVRRGD
jgi:hypothetical protein